jgi:GDP-D-mannose dehydratase
MRSVVEQLIAASDRRIGIEVDETRYKPIDVPFSYGSTDLSRELLGCALSVDWPPLCAEMLSRARARLP